MLRSISRGRWAALITAILVGLLSGCAAELGDPDAYYGDDVPPYDDDLEAAEVGVYEEDGAEGSASEALFGEVILPTSAKCAGDYPEHASRMRDVALREVTEGYFATTLGGDLRFDRTWIDDNEKLALVDLGGGEVALLDRNCRFLSAIGGGGGAVVADKTWIGGWETFDITRLGDQEVRLRTQTGYYLSAGRYSPLSAVTTSTRELILVELEDTREVIIQAGPMRNGEDPRLVRPDGDMLGYGRRLDSHSTVDLVQLGLGEVALRSGAEYWRACSGGGSCLELDRYRLGEHERFVLEPRTWLGTSAWERVAIRTANGRYLYAHPGGLSGRGSSTGSPYYPSSFYIHDVKDAPQRALRSSYNGRYVRAEPTGALKADAAILDHWEKYRVIERGRDSAGRWRIALRNHHGRYLRAVNGGGGALVADTYHVDTHETFTLIPASDGQVALRTHDGHYVRVLSSNVLRADAGGASTPSLFRIITPRPTAIVVGTTVSTFSL